MRLLHTSDWHVGRSIRGRSRADEHAAVLAEVAAIARREAVDVVLVTGDLFDTASPSPESERLVYRALLDLESTGATVVAIAGNHDNERRLQAVAPLFERGRVLIGAAPARPDEGGVLRLTTGSGEELDVGLVPFLSQRLAVRADLLMAGTEAEAVAAYDDRCRRVVGALCQAMRPGAVRVVAAHLFVLGGASGTSERVAHTALGYAVSPHAFPADLHYVALGHLHRPQAVGQPTVRYAGSPLQLDFGEAGEAKSVTLVEVSAGSPGRVTEVPLSAGRALRVVAGTVAQLALVAGTTGDAHVRAVVHEHARPGLADEVRALFPHVVEVAVEAPPEDGAPTRVASRRAGLSPVELVSAYCRAANLDTGAVVALFEELHEEASG
ncbi:MAG: SbcD_Mre11 [uncultured Acidimicrobiales bacterium]|uniref:Nuclease SbcCD subunit D n=1 Tax=uncultured Acidimicrobiales bacterium TaxID=310071 RepID=A0A6J4I568_9ACTN|nr:MAG: SbcD_Mre11 [uncultured Acidimicrobiales bacterium]